MKELKLIETRTKDIYREETYEIGDYTVIVEFVNGEVDRISVKEDWNKEYVPPIYFGYDSIFAKHEKQQFKIQTVAYGAKDITEIQKVIEGYQNAIEVVEVLTKTFIK